MTTINPIASRLSWLCSLVLAFNLIGHDVHAQPRYVTLGLGSEGATNPQPVQLAVAPDETAELVSYPGVTSGSSQLQIQVGGGIHTYWPRQLFQNTGTGPLDPLVVAGPATITLRGGGAAIATFRILPDATAPDRTVLLPPSTNLTSITLESSTNLVSWIIATNGVYGPVPAALFFRIKVATVRQ